MSGTVLLFALTMGCKESLLLKEGDPSVFYALTLISGGAGVNAPNPGDTDANSEGSGLLPTSGNVKGFQKISDTRGNFTGTLADDDQFGTSIAAIGDLDNDGVMDLAVGAEGDDDGGNSRGAVWILFMNADGTVRSTRKISDTQGSFTGTLTDDTHFGGGIAPLGDLNGDGVEDIAVSAKDDDDGGNNHGAVWILFLNTDGTVKSHQKISDTAGNFTGVLEDSDHFGTSVAAVGDVNKDGIVDIAAGSYFDDDGGAGGNRGAVWILFLNTNGTVKSHQKISDTHGNFTGTLDANERFGEVVGGPGDINGDGTPDLVVGTPEDSDDGSVYGSLWVLFLHTSGDGTVSSFQKISDTQGSFTGIFANAERFGRSVGGPGDMDGDGVVDVLAGTYGDDGDGTDRGSVYVLFMNRNGTVKSHQKISDNQGSFAGILNDHDHFGMSVTTLGDINGDRLPDLVAGAWHDDDGGIGDARRGAVWVLNLDE